MPDKNEFYNPFAFVPVQEVDDKLSVSRDELSTRPGKGSGQRSQFQHVTHDRYIATTDIHGQNQTVHSGKLLCRMTLKSPTVIGSSQVGGSPTEVRPYEQLNERNGKLDWEPAIPATTLRGLVSSIFETASNSALRVMSNIAMSRRMEMRKSYSAVGMIIGEKGSRRLVPLAFPILEKQKNFVIPSEFRKYQNQMQLKIYLNWMQLDSFTPDNNQVMFLKCAGDTSFEIREDCLERFTNPKLKGNDKRQNLIGHQLPYIEKKNIGEFLITREQWLELNAADQTKFRPGVVRRLNADIGKHAWFIPLSNQVYDSTNDQWMMEESQSIPCEDAALLYEAMARLRTEADKKKGEFPHRWRSGSEKSKGTVQLKENHLVCFQIDPTTQSPDLSIAAIWRAPAGRLWDWFEQIDKNLAPMNPDRTSVTLAEQLFGFVEQPRFPEDEAKSDDADSVDDMLSKPAVNGLKGRLRFGAASMVTNNVSKVPYLPAATACILSSPKPPSPAMYFRKTPGRKINGKYKSNFPKQADADAIKKYQPGGRKHYLHHDSSLMVWESILPAESTDQKMKLKPMKAGLEFVFPVAFDNLSNDELSLLVYSLSPNDNFQHKLGLGKPLGLGSVRIDVDGLFLIDRQARYSSQKGTLKFDQIEFSGDQQYLESLADNVKVELQHELAALAYSGQDLVLLDGLIKQLQTDGANLVPDPVRTSLETIGDPATTEETPVHYPRVPDSLLPRVAGKPNTEHELYRWHVANDLRANRTETVVSDQGDLLVRLDKRMPWFFFLYDGLREEERTELEELLETHYPGQWQRESKLPNSDGAYKSQITKIRSDGFLPIHLGIRNVHQDHKTNNHRPIGGNVVDEFKRRYLSQLG